MDEQIKEAFKYLNSFKRFRALHETSRSKGHLTESEKLELQMYKAIDQLELSLRGIQKENRTNGEE